MAEAVDPLAERVALAVTGPADQTAAGYTRFRMALAGQSARGAFEAWRDNQVTKLVRDVVRDLALHSARLGFPTDSLLVHHGMTLAFTYVQQLMEDPSLIIPGVFSLSDEGKPSQTPEENYETPPDGAV